MGMLIAEDSAVLRDSLAQVLREAGYFVDSAINCKRALTHPQTTDNDVVILDTPARSAPLLRAGIASPRFSRSPYRAIAADVLAHLQQPHGRQPLRHLRITLR